ncbi:MAG TPA: ATP synthase F1 subunit gamma [Acidobacteriota bacterium]|nr:ATP synthase F1 subunit gamma [Acidobacteriota bacterium]
MPTLINLRRRIRSVRNSQQITQAMKTVSMAKYKKAQRHVLESRPYWHVFPEIAARVVALAEAEGHPLLAERREMKAEVVIVTSDKGLAGAFNANLLAEAQSFIREKSGTAEPGLVLVGKKAVNAFRRTRLRVDRAYPERTDKLGRAEVRELAGFLMRLYALQRTDAIYIVYNEFKSILTPRIVVARLLPVPVPPAAGGTPASAPDWEPEAAGLVAAVLPLYVESQVLHALGESQAAEHAARMMAMDNATKNAEDLIADLVLVLNKIRQATITKELLEIMTAVDALAKSS